MQGAMAAGGLLHPVLTHAGLVSAALAACLLLLTSLCLRKLFTKQQGQYRTNEAKDAERYDNPDAAVVMGQTGQPEVPRKKEYFI